MFLTQINYSIVSTGILFGLENKMPLQSMTRQRHPVFGAVETSVFYCTLSHLIIRDGPSVACTRK